jgi:hypothetical protein
MLNFIGGTRKGSILLMTYQNQELSERDPSIGINEILNQNHIDLTEKGGIEFLKENYIKPTGRKIDLNDKKRIILATVN